MDRWRQAAAHLTGPTGVSGADERAAVRALLAALDPEGAQLGPLLAATPHAPLRLQALAELGVRPTAGVAAELLDAAAPREVLLRRAAAAAAALGHDGPTALELVAGVPAAADPSGALSYLAAVAAPEAAALLSQEGEHQEAAITALAPVFPDAAAAAIPSQGLRSQLRLLCLLPAERARAVPSAPGIVLRGLQDAEDALTRKRAAHVLLVLEGAARQGFVDCFEAVSDSATHITMQVWPDVLAMPQDEWTAVLVRAGVTNINLSTGRAALVALMRAGVYVAGDPGFMLDVLVPTVANLEAHKKPLPPDVVAAYVAAAPGLDPLAFAAAALRATTAPRTWALLLEGAALCPPLELVTDQATFIDALADTFRSAFIGFDDETAVLNATARLLAAHAPDPPAAATVRLLDVAPARFALWVGDEWLERSLPPILAAALDSTVSTLGAARAVAAVRAPEALARAWAPVAAALATCLRSTYTPSRQACNAVTLFAQAARHGADVAAATGNLTDLRGFVETYFLATGAPDKRDAAVGAIDALVPLPALAPLPATLLRRAAADADPEDAHQQIAALEAIRAVLLHSEEPGPAEAVLASSCSRAAAGRAAAAEGLPAKHATMLLARHAALKWQCLSLAVRRAEGPPGVVAAALDALDGATFDMVEPVFDVLAARLPAHLLAQPDPVAAYEAAVDAAWSALADAQRRTQGAVAAMAAFALSPALAAASPAIAEGPMRNFAETMLAHNTPDLARAAAVACCALPHSLLAGAYLDVVVDLLLRVPPSNEVATVGEMSGDEGVVRLVVLDFLCREEGAAAAALAALLPHDDVDAQSGPGKLQYWQAVGALAPHATADVAAPLAARAWRALADPLIDSAALRPQIEAVAGLLAARFPAEVLVPLALPPLADLGLGMIVTSSMLITAGFAVLRMDKAHAEYPAARYELLRRALPWVSVPRCHAHVVAQYVVYELASELSSSDAHELDGLVLGGFLEMCRGQKAMAKALERQRAWFDKHDPAALCSVDALHAASRGAHGELLVDNALERAREECAAIRDSLLFGLPKGDKFAAPPLPLWASAAVAAKDNVQRKIEPWRREEDARRERQPVIVVASLVSKAPNLGGLVRTCEIFAATRLVVGNQAVLEDKLFKAMAVNADKWMPVEEVVEADVAGYLLARKRDGYTIIGLEQSAQSACLTRYAFPDKVVLLLGKEKEGVPVELLNLVDQCIEIPQMGVTRSLNVHVSGALLLWEYTRQRLVGGGGGVGGGRPAGGVGGGVGAGAAGGE